MERGDTIKAIHFATRSDAAWATCRVTNDREKRKITFDLKEVTCKLCLFYSDEYPDWSLPVEERDRLHKEYPERVRNRI